MSELHVLALTDSNTLLHRRAWVTQEIVVVARSPLICGREKIDLTTALDMGLWLGRYTYARHDLYLPLVGHFADTTLSGSRSSARHRHGVSALLELIPDGQDIAEVGREAARISQDYFRSMEAACRNRQLVALGCSDYVARLLDANRAASRGIRLLTAQEDAFWMSGCYGKRTAMSCRKGV